MTVLVKLTFLFAFTFITKGWRLGPYARLLNEIKHSQSLNDVPISENGDPVELKMVIELVNIFNCDPVTKTVSLNAWVLINWNSSLTWSPKEFGGLEQITVPYSYNMWKPGFLNGLNGFDKLENEITDTLYVHSSGLVKLMSRYTFWSFCDFEEDQLASNVTCTLTLSTMYMSSAVKFADLGDKGVFLNYYFPGSKYEILEASSTPILVVYNGLFDHKLSQVIFKFSFKLKT